MSEDKCPHCGAAIYPDRGEWRQYKCGTYGRVDGQGGLDRAPGCYEHEIAELKRQLAETERQQAGSGN